MAGMLFATSCAKDVEVADASTATVTFNVGLENALSTRAINQGETTDKLFYAVFNSAGESVGDTESQDLTSLTTTVKVTLVAGEEYTAYFWAQNKDCEAYDLDDFPVVKVSYDNAKNNDDSRDAFFGSVKFTAGDTNVSVTLKRPFAQINLGLTVPEGKDAPKVTESAMTIENVCSEIDLTTGKASEEVTAVFANNAIPEEKLKVTQNQVTTEYMWLSMSYVLVNAEKSNVYDVTFTFNDGESKKIEGIPAQRNFRTNLLASENVVDTDIEVIIDPETGGDNNDDDIAWVDPDDDGDDDGDDQEATFTVSEVNGSYADGTLTLSAKYDGEAEVKTAKFYYELAADALTRAQTSGEVEVQPEGIDAATKTITATTTVELEPGNYTIKVEINGKEASASGEAGTPAPSFPVTDQTPGGGDETPEGNTFISDDIFVCDGSANPAGLAETTINGEAASGVKLGASSKVGVFTSEAVNVTGDYTLTFYAVAWKGANNTQLKVSLEGAGTIASGSTFTLDANDGATGGPTFTITGVSDANKYVINFTGLTANTKIKFETTNSNAGRAVVAGIKLTEGLSENPTDPTPDTTDPGTGGGSETEQPVDGKTTTITLSTYFSADENIAEAEGKVYTFGDFEFTFTKKNSNVSNYKSSENGIRFYKDDIVKIDGKGKKISKIVINTYGGATYCKNMTADTGSATANTSTNTITWTGAAVESVTLTNSEAQTRFTSFDITYVE